MLLCCQNISMEDFLELEAISWANEPRHFQKRPSESCSDDNEWKSISPEILPTWVLDSLPNPGCSHSNNQPRISSGVVRSPITNVSTAQAFQSSNSSNGSPLKRNLSSVSEPDRAQRKRMVDMAYRARCKDLKEKMQMNMENLKGENESLKKENESLKRDNSLMDQTLRDQEKEIEKLRSDLLQLKHEHEKQSVLVQTLSGLLADPVRLENEKLKDENASLRRNANLNGNLQQLMEENAKLKTENKVLKVQNDALCGKIISDNDKKRKQEHWWVSRPISASVVVRLRCVICRGCHQGVTLVLLPCCNRNFDLNSNFSYVL